jgi:hypothetical protein
MVNDLILEEKAHPLYSILDRMPFYVQRFEVNEGEFWGESPIVQAWHIQRERNRLLTQIREHRELTLRPKLLNPTGNRLGVSEIDTTPGQILGMSQYGQAPRWLETPQLPQYAYTELQRMEVAMRQLFGVTEQEIGVTRADQSGRSAAILEAQSSESIAPIIVVNNEEWKELYRGILVTAQEYYSAQRTWTVTGREKVRSYVWAEANLKQGWDVSLQESDSLSKNPAVRQQQLNDWWQMGIFMDPSTGTNDTRTFLRMTGAKFPGIGPDSEASERAYFASLPERIKRGEQFAPRPWDDPWIAQEELVSWLRGPGRSGEAPQLVQMIGNIYMYYSSMLPFTPMSMHVSPNPMGAQAQGQPGQQGQQAGKSENTAFGPGAPFAATNARPQQQGTVAQESAENVQNADQEAERQSRIQRHHEG